MIFRHTSVQRNRSPIIVMRVNIFLFQGWGGTFNIRHNNFEVEKVERAHTGMISRVNWVG